MNDDEKKTLYEYQTRIADLSADIKDRNQQIRELQAMCRRYEYEIKLRDLALKALLESQQ